jgi:hypothetical protein
MRRMLRITTLSICCLFVPRVCLASGVFTGGPEWMWTLLLWLHAFGTDPVPYLAPVVLVLNILFLRKARARKEPHRLPPQRIASAILVVNVVSLAVELCFMGSMFLSGASLSSSLELKGVPCLGRLLLYTLGVRAAMRLRRHTSRAADKAPTLNV